MHCPRQDKGEEHVHLIESPTGAAWGMSSPSKPGLTQISLYFHVNNFESFCERSLHETTAFNLIRNWDKCLDMAGVSRNKEIKSGCSVSGDTSHSQPSTVLCTRNVQQLSICRPLLELTDTERNNVSLYRKRNQKDSEFQSQRGLWCYFVSAYQFSYRI